MPTQIVKADPSAVVNNDITPDGLPVATTAAPPSSHVAPASAPSQASDSVPVDSVTTANPEEGTVDDDDGSAKDLNFESFIDAKSTVTEPKVVTSPTKTTTPAATPATTPAAKVEPAAPSNARDVSDLDDEDKPLFKQMSNEAFNKLKPIVKEHKALKQQVEQLKQGRVPESYYEHPDAYILTPEFRSAAENVQRANLIYNHWVNQLQAVREGAREFDYLDTDPKTGQYVVSQKIAADVKSETQLLTYVNYAQNLMMNARAGLQQVQAGYNNYHAQAVNAIKQQENQYFSAFDKPENKDTYAPLIRQQLEIIPPSFRSSPIAMAYAKSLVLNGVLAKLLNQAATKVGTSITAKATPKHPAAQPTAGEAAGEGGGNGKSADVSFEDFSKIKEGY